MNSLRFLFDRQVRYFATAVVLVLATFMPVLASAAQLTERSVELSSSVKGATGVTYKVDFTAETDLEAGAVVINFCSNSPLIGQACTPAAGFTAAGATTAGGWSKHASSSATTFIATGDVADGTNTITLTGVTNPTNAGPLYARIMTFADPLVAAAYVPATPGAYTDDGSVAISITDNIGVSGIVQESLIFCVANKTIAADCEDIDPVDDAPTLALGEEGTSILNAGTLYTGSIFTQLSTNAAGGAVVSLKSNAVDCGGLVRAGAANNTVGCGLAPAGFAAPDTVDTSTNSGKFGMTLSDATSVAGGSPVGGTLVRVDGYSSTLYKMNFVSGNASGVTSTYGDNILHTNDAPASNQQVEVTFGVAANNSTPAGLYSADFAMIATGKF